MKNPCNLIAELEMASNALARAHARAFANQEAGEHYTRRILALYESVATLTTELERHMEAA